VDTVQTYSLNGEETVLDSPPVAPLRPQLSMPPPPPPRVAVAAARSHSTQSHVGQEAKEEVDELNRENVIDLPKSQCRVLPSRPNGWCFYLSVISAIKMLRDPTDTEVTDEEAQELATEISDYLRGLPQNDPSIILIQGLLQRRIPAGPADQRVQALDAAKAAIDADPAIEEEIKGALKESLDFQYRHSAEGAVYETDRNGKVVDSVEEYITGLNTPFQGDVHQGPLIWPDASIIGRLVGIHRDVGIRIYVPRDSDYHLIADFADEGIQNYVTIVYVNRNHYDILVCSPPPSTDATARELPRRPQISTTRATIGSRFLSALKTAKRKLTFSSLKKGIGKLGAGLKKAYKLVRTGQFKGEIIVSGERVRIDETDFNEAKFVDVVSFSKKYFPGYEGDDLETAKAVFSMIFHINYDSSKNNFLPPCNAEEREILMLGLINRRQTLFTEMKKIQLVRGDAVILRTKLELYERLSIIIGELERHEAAGRCQEYNPDGSPAGFKKVNLKDEDEMRNLLRQFAFLVLQAKMEVPQYSYATADAKELLTKLNQEKISQDEMEQYLLMWREQALAKGEPENIPRIIAEILDGVNAQPGLLQLMLDDELESLFAQIVETARREYDVDTGRGGPPQILIAFNDFIRTLEEQGADFKTKVLRLILWIIQKNKECWDILSGLRGEEAARVRELQRHTAELAESQRELAAAQRRLEESEARYRGCLGQSAGLEGNAARTQAALERLNAEFEAYKESQARALEAAQRESQCRGDQGAVRTEIEKLQARIGEAEARAAAAAAANTAINRDLAAERSRTAILERERDLLRQQLPPAAAAAAARLEAPPQLKGAA